MRHGALAAVVVFAASLCPAYAGSPFGVECAAASGSVSVPVVIDLGDLGGNAPPEVTCVTVADGASGTDALVARARRLGRPAPRFSAAGFLCGVDGRPASGCGDDPGSSVAYWSYWWASASHPTWRYGTRGSDLRSLQDGFIEGWRYVVGTASQGSNLAPRVNPATLGCASPTDPPGAPAPATPFPANTPVVSPATALPPSADSPAPFAGPEGPGPVPDPLDALPTTSIPADGSSTTTPTTVPPTSTTTTTTGPSEVGSEQADGGDSLADDNGGEDDDSRSWTGTGAAVIVVAASAGLAVVQGRRRRLRE